MRITLVSADIKNNTDTFGKLDPYVVISLGDNVQESKKYEDAGTKPVFKDETHTFPIADLNTAKFHFEVRDNDNMSSDLCGSFDISGTELAKCESGAEHKLFYDNKKDGGLLKLKAEFTP